MYTSVKCTLFVIQVHQCTTNDVNDTADVHIIIITWYNAFLVQEWYKAVTFGICNVATPAETN